MPLLSYDLLLSLSAPVLSYTFVVDANTSQNIESGDTTLNPQIKT